MSEKRNGKEIIGKITTKTSKKGYKSYWIYLPSKISKDDAFPFMDGDEVEIELTKDGRLNIRKHDKLRKIINQYGLENATLPKVLEEKAKKNQDEPFLFFQDQVYSYKNLNNKSNQVAHGLIELLERIGLRKPGKKFKKSVKIGAILSNTPDFIFCWFGASKTRSTFIPLDPHLKGKALLEMLQDIEADLLIMDYRYLDNFKEISEYIPKIKKIIIQNYPDNFKAEPPYMPYSQLISSNKQNPPEEVKDMHEMEILYTAGTTGKPKGLSFRNYYVLTGVNVGKELHEIGLTQDSIIYCPLPLHHALGQLLTILPAIFYDASVVITEDFDPEKFWENVNRYKISGLVFFGGFLHQLINQKPSKKDRQHSIEWAFGFAATRDSWETFEKRFGIPIYQGWTQTEAVGITINKVGSKGGKIGSVGEPVSGYELKVVDEEGKILPPGKENVGKLVARSTIPIPLEYFKNKKTKTTPSNSWVETGDYGYKDSDGFFYYVGRESDRIQTNGETFFATEIEKLINAHPFILESAAFEVENEKGNKQIKVCIVLKESYSLSHEEIDDYLSQNLAHYMVPRYIEISKTLPKSTNYFVRKFKLKKEWGEEDSQAHTWDATLKKIIN